MLSSKLPSAKCASAPICSIWYLTAPREVVAISRVCVSRAVTKKTACILGFYPLPAARRSAKYGVGWGKSWGKPRSLLGFLGYWPRVYEMMSDECAMRYFFYAISGRLNFIIIAFSPSPLCGIPSASALISCWFLSCEHAELAHGSLVYRKGVQVRIHCEKPMATLNPPCKPIHKPGV